MYEKGILQHPVGALEYTGHNRMLHRVVSVCPFSSKNVFIENNKWISELNHSQLESFLKV